MDDRYSNPGVTGWTAVVFDEAHGGVGTEDMQEHFEFSLSNTVTIVVVRIDQMQMKPRRDRPASECHSYCRSV